jgi:hypothetical protein
LIATQVITKKGTNKLPKQQRKKAAVKLTERHNRISAMKALRLSMPKAAKE